MQSAARLFDRTSLIYINLVSLYFSSSGSVTGDSPTTSTSSNSGDDNQAPCSYPSTGNYLGFLKDGLQKTKLITTIN